MLSVWKNLLIMEWWEQNLSLSNISRFDHRIEINNATNLVILIMLFYTGMNFPFKFKLNQSLQKETWYVRRFHPHLSHHPCEHELFWSERKATLFSSLSLKFTFLTFDLSGWSIIFYCQIFNPFSYTPLCTLFCDETLKSILVD